MFFILGSRRTCRLSSKCHSAQHTALGMALIGHSARCRILSLKSLSCQSFGVPVASAPVSSARNLRSAPGLGSHPFNPKTWAPYRRTSRRHCSRYLLTLEIISTSTAWNRSRHNDHISATRDGPPHPDGHGHRLHHAGRLVTLTTTRVPNNC